MSLREFANNNSAIVTLGAVVLLVIALGAIIMQTRGGGGSRSSITDVYYYDLNTGELFPGPSDQIAPIDAPSGPYNGKPGGVRAFVFSCEDCDDESTHFIGWLDMYTAEAKEALTNPNADMSLSSQLYEQGRMIKRVEDETWVPSTDVEAYTVMENIKYQCPGGRPQPCYP